MHEIKYNANRIDEINQQITALENQKIKYMITHFI